ELLLGEDFSPQLLDELSELLLLLLVVGAGVLEPRELHHGDPLPGGGRHGALPGRGRCLLLRRLLPGGGLRLLAVLGGAPFVSGRGGGPVLALPLLGGGNSCRGPSGGPHLLLGGGDFCRGSSGGLGPLLGGRGPHLLLGGRDSCRSSSGGPN